MVSFSTLRLSALTLAVAALSGCAFIPAHERPALPVPAAYPMQGAECHVRCHPAGLGHGR